MLSSAVRSIAKPPSPPGGGGLGAAPRRSWAEAGSHCDGVFQPSLSTGPACNRRQGGGAGKVRVEQDVLGPQEKGVEQPIDLSLVQSRQEPLVAGVSHGGDAAHQLIALLG